MIEEESDVIRLIRSFKTKLLNREARQVAEMTRRWLALEDRIEGLTYMLAADVSERYDTGTRIGVSQLVTLDRYQALLAQVDYELAQYSEWLGASISDAQASNIRFGIQSSTQAIQAIYDANGVTANFRTLPVDAVRNLIGYAGDGSLLVDYLKVQLPLTTVQGLTNALIEAVALGNNPRQSARLMAEGGQMGLQQALTIMRTEQLRPYREASRQNMAASGVVSGYKRIATRDTRVCPACLFDDGKVYKLSDEFAEHVCGRCSLVPIVIGMPEITWQYGRDWFMEQSPEDQISILGQGRYDAWKAKKFNLSEIVKTIPNETWGPSIQAKSLKELTQ